MKNTIKLMLLRGFQTAIISFFSLVFIAFLVKNVPSNPGLVGDWYKLNFSWVLGSTLVSFYCALIFVFYQKFETIIPNKEMFKILKIRRNDSVDFMTTFLVSIIIGIIFKILDFFVLAIPHDYLVIAVMAIIVIYGIFWDSAIHCLIIALILSVIISIFDYIKYSNFADVVNDFLFWCVLFTATAIVARIVKIVYHNLFVRDYNFLN